MGIFAVHVSPFMIPLYPEKRTIVVLDLDHTLVHTVLFHEDHEAFANTETFRVGHNDGTTSTVFVRPHTFRFLETLSGAGIKYAVWTAGTEEYARDVCAGLAWSYPAFSPEFVYDRSHTEVVGGRHLKNISSITSVEKVILIDDDPSHGHFSNRNSHVMVVPKFRYTSPDDVVFHLLAERVLAFFCLF